LVSDTSWYGDQAHIGLLPRAFSRAVHLRGTCLSLASDFANGNYGHYLLDCLPRLELFKRAGGDLAAVEHFFIPKPPSRSAQRLVEAMSIPPTKCVWAEDSSWVTADMLVATSFPGLKRNYPNWLPASLQQYSTSLPPSGTRVYIPRTGVRKAINEDELIAVAAEFGFEVYDYERCADEPSFFSSVSAVVGPHGAGMTNLAFCRPGTKVLELIPSDHVHPYFYTLAESAKLDYHCLMGESQGTRPSGAFGPSPFDFAVDTSEFRAALVAMELGRG
jgi:capsular polysaccharide biosynthesis protein